MEIIKSGKNKGEYIERYRIRCNCGCVYVVDWNEAISMTKSMSDNCLRFQCPECGIEHSTVRMGSELVKYKAEDYDE